MDPETFIYREPNDPIETTDLTEVISPVETMALRNQRSCKILYRSCRTRRSCRNNRSCGTRRSCGNHIRSCGAHRAYRNHRSCRTHTVDLVTMIIQFLQNYYCLYYRSCRDNRSSRTYIQIPQNSQILQKPLILQNSQIPQNSYILQDS